jgi:hypothetical protein
VVNAEQTLKVLGTAEQEPARTVSSARERASIPNTSGISAPVASAVEPTVGAVQQEPGVQVSQIARIAKTENEPVSSSSRPNDSAGPNSASSATVAVASSPGSAISKRRLLLATIAALSVGLVVVLVLINRARKPRHVSLITQSIDRNPRP